MRCWFQILFFAVCGAACAAFAASDWVQHDGYRTRSVSPAGSGKTGFTLMAPAVTSVTFTNELSDELAAQNQIRMNGSGVALGEVVGDGLCDIHFWGLEGPNALY